MVIQCPECQTRFRLADDKIKADGIKVRCSRCRHIFAVPPPAPEPPPQEEGVDFGAFNMESVPGPGETAEGADDREAPQPAAAAAESPAVPVVAAAAAEPRDPGDADGEDAAGHDELTFDEDDDSSEPGFSLPPEETVGEEDFAFNGEEDNLEGSAGGTDDGFAFGEIPAGGIDADRFSFPDPGVTGEAAGSDTKTDFAFAGPEEDLPLEGNEFSFGEKENSWNMPGDGPADEFDFAPDEPAGDSEDFDFSNLSFGEEPPASRDQESPPPGRTEAAPVRLESPASASSAAATAPSGPVAAPLEASPREPLMPPPPKKRKGPVSGILIFVVLLLLVLSGTAAFFFWQDGIPDLGPLLARVTGETPPPVAAGQIKLADLNGYFVANGATGQLFVIQGRAINAYPDARSAIAVKGVLLSKGGKPVLQQTVFSGNMLDEGQLRSLPFAKIEESMNNQFGDSLSNLNVAPGKSIPFTIVFKNLPADLAEFTVEVTDSKPGAG